MNNLPKDFKTGVEYSLLISSESDSKWIETEKSEKRSEIVANSVGSFRNDLKKLKALRRQLAADKKGKTSVLANDPILPITHELIKYETIAHETITQETITHDTIAHINSPLTTTDILTTSIELNNKSPFTKPPTLTLTPSNPLIDQTVKIIKPTGWIDCISRESKRVFVKDNWIVARILLPQVSKDSIGLKRLTLE